MKLYYAKIDPLFKKDLFSVPTGWLEQKRLDVVRKRKKEKARAQSLAAGLLLHAGLCDYLQLPVEETPPFQTACGKWGKPYLTEYPGVYFNLSHSGEYVCCAIAEEEVGVDIQQHQGQMEGIAKRFFTKADNQMLEDCSEAERRERFFRIWSIRESYIKFTGRGMGQGLDTFAIDFSGKTVVEQGRTVAYFQEDRKMEGYSLCVCTGHKKLQAVWNLTDIFQRSPSVQRGIRDQL